LLRKLRDVIRCLKECIFMKAVIHIEKVEFEKVVMTNVRIEVERDLIEGSLEFKTPPKPEAPQKAPKDKVESVKRGLEEAFAKTGLSTAEIADLIGVTDWSVRSWCLGYHRPTIDKINKIADMLEVSPRDVQRLLPRARRKTTRREGKPKLRLGYAIEPIGPDRFTAKDGETAVIFTIRRHRSRALIDKIETNADTPLARKVARDGNVSGFGRLCHITAVNSAKKKKKAKKG